MSVVPLLELVASVSAAIFAGAALYMNVVEHPARMTLDTTSAASEWAPSNGRATWMQAPLALISLPAGLACWWLGAGSGWAIGAVLIGAVVPFTFIGLIPTNRSLLEPGRDFGSQETRALLLSPAAYGGRSLPASQSAKGFEGFGWRNWPKRLSLVRCPNSPNRRLAPLRCRSDLWT